jgi:hypothetical protein
MVKYRKVLITRNNNINILELKYLDLGTEHPVVFKAQYLNEIKYVLCLSQLSFISLFQMLATSFGLNRPSLGQYWPDDALLGRK